MTKFTFIARFLDCLIGVLFSAAVFVSTAASATDDALPVQPATVCGVYLIEDYGSVEVRSITNLSSPHSRQIHYTISNETSALVQGLLQGQCYCVEGILSLDPQFGGDHDFHVIQIDRLLRTCKSHL